ncbi:hypothetical protein IHN63_02070 [Deinococcus sp. 6YEL10]|uniref:hypothetical protein n=1 Tax=Deinococcus sp. 6YEL10 TaxID=2745870 RepID=UPI001E2F825A|nr:hypothetical protein [Deinococcus sp. 6YEL10]MCD0160086.1 hypothetical protein [Deinococcus sp. 6YEL10]
MTDRTIRDALEAELLRTYQQNIELESTLRLARHERRLLKPQPARWPVRVLWGGWPVPYRPGRPIRPGTGASWFDQHGSEEWYATIRYVRIGPVILELGRRPALDEARQSELDFFHRVHRSARDSAQTRLATLRRHVDGPSGRH